MRETVRLLRDKAEYILINAPSVHDANAQALCTLADAVLIVVTLGQTTRADIEQAYTEAERAGAIVIGTVVEEPRSRRANSGDSGGGQSRSSSSRRGDHASGPSGQQREPDYSPGTAVSRRSRPVPPGAPTPPASGNTSTTATSPDWSRFSGEEDVRHHQPENTSDSTETAVHKAIEA
jgi:hypothetical protein